MVYVVAFEYDNGGSFDWYDKKEEAIAAWKAALKNVQTPAARETHLTAYCFKVDVSYNSPHAITRYIANSLSHFEDAKTTKRTTYEGT